MAERIGPDRSGPLVEARLGRPPQDMLEAAVVLEAWAGVPARARARRGARRSWRRTRRRPRRAAGPLPAPPEREGFASEAVSFVLAVLAIACWAAPLAAALGTEVVRHGLLVALPLTLALQWGLRSRYLGRPQGLAHLRRHGRELAALPRACSSAASRWPWA